MEKEKKATSPFWEYLHIEELFSEKGEAKIKCEVSPELLNFSGFVHGGVLATLIDASIGSAVRSTLSEGQHTATIDLNIKYIRAAKGPILITKSVLAHRGGTTVVGTSEIFDDNGNLSAIGSATFMILKSKN